MFCEKCVFTNFRNLENVEVTFSDGINVLWGKNAQGKSNILEGVYYFARGRSFRGAKDREMIMFGRDFAKLEMTCRNGGAEYATPLEIVIPADTSERKKVYRNKAKLSGMTELVGNFRAVLFCPSHLYLVSGAPKARRQFLDIAISQLSERYMRCLADYGKVLIHRNALLKASAKGEKFPAVLWETLAEQMSKSGAVIASYRYEYMSLLSEKMDGIFSEMTNGTEKPKLTYVTHAIESNSAAECENSDLDFAPCEPVPARGEIDAKKNPSFGENSVSCDALFNALTSDIEKEIRYGTTLKGIHKDDIKIKLNGASAKLYASQGQMRSLALAMKLAEGELSYAVGGEKPVMLLDDVLSELDGDRRAFVLGALSDRQIIVTSCEPSPFDGVAGKIELLNVEDGKVGRICR